MSRNTIELTDRQRKRIESIKDECKEADPGLPRLTDDQVLSSLLDTWDAVNEGVYSEDSDRS